MTRWFRAACAWSVVLGSWSLALFIGYRMGGPACAALFGIATECLFQLRGLFGFLMARKWTHQCPGCCADLCPHCGDAYSSEAPERCTDPYEHDFYDEPQVGAFDASTCPMCHRLLAPPTSGDHPAAQREH